jgi:hemerythrin-like domain-containing protein
MAKQYVDLTIMLVSHNAFRRDIRRLQTAAERHSLEDPQQRSRILSGWGVFKNQLHVHHHGEDRDLWPRMTAGLTGRPAIIATLEELEAEHEEIDPLLTRLDAAMEGPVINDTELVSAIDALATSLESHLEHEEKEGLPYIAESLSEEDWKAFLKDQQQNLGLSGAAEFFPWLLDDAKAEDAARVNKILPAPLRLVMNVAWKPMYRTKRTWANI